MQSDTLTAHRPLVIIRMPREQLRRCECMKRPAVNTTAPSVNAPTLPPVCALCGGTGWVER